MSSFVPIPVFYPTTHGDEPLSIEGAWIIGVFLILMVLATSVTTGVMARLLWNDDLRGLSVLAWCISVSSFVGLTYIIITGIIIPAYGG